MRRSTSTEPSRGLKHRGSVLSTGIVGIALLVSVQGARAQPSWNVYDVRDLIGLVPPTESAHDRGEISHIAEELLRVRNGEGALLDSLAALRSVGGAAGPIDAMISQICDALEIEETRLLLGVYAIEAEEPQHALVLRLLEEIRALYSERYQVELVVFEAAARDAPAIGSVVSAGGPQRRQQLVVTRRTPVPVSLATLHTYLADTEPVVAQGVVGYDASPGSVSDGLHVTIMVGAQKEDAGGTSLLAVGELHNVTLGKTIAEGPAEAANMKLEFPTVAVRTIQSNIRAEFGKLTVVAVADGFAREQCTVIAAAVRKLEK